MTTAPASRARQALTLVAIMLLALNLRPSVNAFGAVLPEMREAVGLSSLDAGVLTALPTLCFALLGLLGPTLVRALGPDRAVVLALCGIIAGNLLRVLAPGFFALFLGSVLALGCMAVGNVMLPSLARKYFAHRIAGITAIYAAMLSGGAALAAAVTLPIEHGVGGDWRVGLGTWAATAFIALMPWLAVARNANPSKAANSSRAATPKTAANSANSATPASAPHLKIFALARFPHMWAMVLFFALQSANAYVIFQWLPTVLKDFGLTAEIGSQNVAVVSVTTMLLSFAVPTLARKYALPLLIALGLANIAGYLGLYFAPLAATYLWSVLLGIGGTIFSLALYIITLRSRTVETTLATSTFTQALGYLLAAAGPFGFVLIHDALGSWHTPIIVMIVLCALDVVLGYFCLRNWTVEELLNRPARKNPA